MDRWTAVELFIHIAERGSLSRAAEAMSVSNATASRLLAGLEERLGARLVQRNTRRLFLTDIGHDYYRRCKTIAGDMLEADSAVNAAAVNPSGTLTVTASLSCCLEHVVPLLSEFHRRYPDVTVQIVAANRYLDIIDNDVDVAIRTREYEADSNLTIRRLAEMRRVLAASPQYLMRNGVPAAPEDLLHHRMLIYTHANRPEELRLGRAGRTHTVRVRPFLEANDGQILRNAAIDGLGILVQPSYIIHDDIVAGRLVPLLADYELPRLMMNVAYPSRRHLSAKVRVFIDFLVEDFRTREYEQHWLR